jgi:hypothetical protein
MAAMAARRAAVAGPPVVGGHVPVLLDEVVHFVDPRPGRTVVDASFGAGGYTRRFLGTVGPRAYAWIGRWSWYGAS